MNGITNIKQWNIQAHRTDKQQTERVYRFLHRFYPIDRHHSNVQTLGIKHIMNKKPPVCNKAIIAGHQIVQSCHRNGRDRSESSNNPSWNPRNRQNKNIRQCITSHRNVLSASNFSCSGFLAVSKGLFFAGTFDAFFCQQNPPKTTNFLQYQKKEKKTASESQAMNRPL